MRTRRGLGAPESERPLSYCGVLRKRHRRLCQPGGCECWARRGAPQGRAIRHRNYPPARPGVSDSAYLGGQGARLPIPVSEGAGYAPHPDAASESAWLLLLPLVLVALLVCVSHGRLARVCARKAAYAAIGCMQQLACNTAVFQNCIVYPYYWRLKPHLL